MQDYFFSSQVFYKYDTNKLCGLCALADSSMAKLWALNCKFMSVIPSVIEYLKCMYIHSRFSCERITCLFFLFFLSVFFLLTCAELRAFNWLKRANHEEPLYLRPVNWLYIQCCSLLACNLGLSYLKNKQ